MARGFHETVLSGENRQAIRRETYREGGGCLLPDEQCMKTERPVAEVLREKYPDMRVPPMENPTCAAFEEYEDVPETVPLDFMEDDVTWVASKLSGAAGAMGAEAMELRNWLLRFGCASEELRFVVASLADWMANSSPPWAAYRALMACRLVVLDKQPGVRPMGIGETLCQALAKVVMRAAKEQAKTACGNLQLCAGLEAGIEGATHNVGQQRQARLRERREDAEEVKFAEEEEEESGGNAAGLHNLNIETAATEEEEAEGLAAALGIEVEEDRGSEGEDEGGGTQRALEALQFLTRKRSRAEPSGTTLVYARNGFNELSRLTLWWTVRHHCPAGVRFAFNFYRHWAQLLLRQLGEPLVTILSREVVTQGDPLSMVLYGITLVPLEEDLRAADPGLLSSFYADDAAFGG